MLLKLHFKAPVSIVYIEAATLEGIIQSRCKRLVRTNLHDSLESGGEIAAIVVENRRPSADLRGSRWRLGTCPELVVESPSANSFPDGQHLGSPLRVGNA